MAVAGAVAEQSSSCTRDRPSLQHKQALKACRRRGGGWQLCDVPRLLVCELRAYKIHAYIPCNVLWLLLPLDQVAAAQDGTRKLVFKLTEGPGAGGTGSTGAEGGGGGRQRRKGDGIVEEVERTVLCMYEA